MLVRIEDVDRAFASWHFYRNDLVLEASAVDRGDGLLLGSIGEFILRFAGDVIFLGDVVGSDAHVDVVHAIGQSIVQHAVDELHVAHLDAVAHFARH